jgi:hypothetical protein
MRIDEGTFLTVRPCPIPDSSPADHFDMGPKQPPLSSIPAFESFELSTFPPEVAARLGAWGKRLMSASARLAAARAEMNDAQNEIDALIKEQADHVAGTESQALEVGKRLAALKRFLASDEKQSRMKASGARLINSDDYSEADEQRTKRAAYERVEELAKTYFPDVPEDILETFLLAEVKAYLDERLAERFHPQTHPISR